MSLAVGALGWQHDGWNGSYYPEDLPADWRLSFYANDFPVVLVPMADWQQAGTAGFEQWLDDTPASFRFYFQLVADPAALHIAERLLPTAGQVLGQRFAGIAVWPGTGVEPDAGQRDLPDIPRSLIDLSLYLTETGGDERPAVLQRLLDSGEAGVCLLNQRSLHGVGPGVAWIALLDVMEWPDATGLRQLRQVVERAVMTGTGAAVLLFAGELPVIDTMRQAQTIAALLSGEA